MFLHTINENNMLYCCTILHAAVLLLRLTVYYTALIFNSTYTVLYMGRAESAPVKTDLLQNFLFTLHGS